MNNQFQFGREAFERGRTKKQRQEDYRNALQRQMREREESRRRSNRKPVVEDRLNSAEQLRDITTRHRVVATPEVSPPSSSSNNNVVQQVMSRNAAHISDILARLRRIETEQTKHKFQVDPVEDIKSETEHRLEIIQQKLENAESLASSVQRKSEERVKSLQTHVRELGETLIAQRKKHERIQTALMQRIELLERRSSDSSSAPPAVEQKRIQQLESALEKLQTISTSETRKAMAERRAHSLEMRSMRDELQKIRDKSNETIQESKALVRHAVESSAQKHLFLQKVEDVDRADVMLELKKHIETLQVSVREESTQWRERVKSLENKISQERQVTKETVRRREIASAEQTVKLQEQLSEAIESVVTAMEQKRKASGEEWSNWERATARALDTLRDTVDDANARSAQRFRTLEDVLRAEVTTRNDEIEALSSSLQQDKDRIQETVDTLKKTQIEWHKSCNKELLDSRVQLEDLGKKLRTEVKDCVIRATRELREHEERVENLLADTKRIEESARVFKKGQKAMEAFQRRVIEEKIREAVKDSEQRCDESCARRLQVTSKAARVLITEAMQTAISQAEKTSRSFTQEQNVIRQHKTVRRIREMEERCKKARDEMESKCMDAAKSCCEEIVQRHSEIHERRMDSISEQLRLDKKDTRSSRDEAIQRLETKILDSVEQSSRKRFEELSENIRVERIRVIRDSDSASKHRKKIEETIRDVFTNLEKLREDCDMKCEEAVVKERTRQDEHARATRDKLNAQLQSHMTAIKISTRSEIRDINEELRRHVEQIERTIRSEQRVLGESVADRLQLIWSDMLNTVHEETAARLRGDAALRARLISQEQSTRELELESETRSQEIELALKSVRHSSSEVDRKIHSIREQSQVASVLSGMVDQIVHLDSREQLEQDLSERMSEVDLLRSEISSLKLKRVCESTERRSNEVREIIDGVLSDVVASSELKDIQNSIRETEERIMKDRDIRHVIRSLVDRVSEENEREQYENVLRNTRVREREEMEYLERTVSMLSEQESRMSHLIRDDIDDDHQNEEKIGEEKNIEDEDAADGDQNEEKIGEEKNIEDEDAADGDQNEENVVDNNEKVEEKKEEKK